MKYAITEAGKVVNIVLWDGDTESWNPEEGQEAVALPNVSSVAIGHLYAAGVFTDPTPKPAAPTQASLIADTQALTRTMRQPVIQILDGMQASALVKLDSARATAIETAKQGLKDITKLDLTPYATADQMKAAVMKQYKALAAALPADVRLAFAGAVS
jgi:hypothetical protein